MFPSCVPSQKEMKERKQRSSLSITNAASDREVEESCLAVRASPYKDSHGNKYLFVSVLVVLFVEGRVCRKKGTVDARLLIKDSSRSVRTYEKGKRRRKMLPLASLSLDGCGLVVMLSMRMRCIGGDDQHRVSCVLCIRIAKT